MSLLISYNMDKKSCECGQTTDPQEALCPSCRQAKSIPDPLKLEFEASQRLQIAQMESKFTRVKQAEEREFTEAINSFDASIQDIMQTVHATLMTQRQGLVDNHIKFQTLLQALAPNAPSQDLQYVDSRLNMLLTQPRLIDYEPEKLSVLRNALTRFLRFGDQNDSLLRGFGYVPILLQNILVKCPFSSGQTEHNPLPIRTTIDSGSAYCVFWDAKMLVTGGKFHSDCYSVDPFTSMVRQTTSMLTARAFHGLVFTHNAAHVFGGSTASGLLNLCEKYEVESATWRALPKMIYNRHGINPCEITGKVYIAGGGANTIEAFDISAQYFSSLPVMLPGIKWTTCLNIDGQLCLLHVGKMYTMDVSEELPTLKPVRDVEKKSWWSNLEPLEHDGCVYFLHPFNEAREVMKLRKNDLRLTKLADFSP